MLTAVIFNRSFFICREKIYLECKKASLFSETYINRPNGRMFKIMAEWRGLEPPRPFDPNGLANRPLHRLEYHS